MSWIAWKMLTGDRSKYFGILFGIAFAALLMAQQLSIFVGLMRNTTSQIRDVQGFDIWVMDNNVQFIDDLKPMSDNELQRVRGVEGVDWAVRFYKNLARAKLESGNYQQVILLGLDDATLVGAPQEIIVGKLADLRAPDAVMMDEAGWNYMWPDQPFEVGRTLEMNDHRAVIVGLCKSSPTFQTFPVVYARFSQATQFAPRERRVMSFVLVQSKPDVPASVVCERIHAQTGLQALHRDEFFWKTIDYYMRRTGIPINFGITVALGFFVGAAIAGQTFYMFTLENLKQFGSLKAMGVSNLRIVGMILLQAFIVALFGYCIGVGGAAGFGVLMGYATKGIPPAFYMTWHILIGVAVAVVVIAMLASLLSIRRVIVLEPAIVFK
ncbi:MAG TPA: ABC transporter permease [Pirellulaceae bacterium]|nr:ABC transporter permease [Pirellulaceae bacterium]